MNNREKIESIYNLYVDDLFTYATYLGFNKDTVLDAIHDVFCKLSSDSNILQSVINIRFYLFRSLKNRLLDIHKTEKTHLDLTLFDSDPDYPFDIDVTIEDDFIDKEEQERIRKRIDEMLKVLTPRQREIIYLRYVQEYDYTQISELLNISIHGCRKLTSTAIQNLRKKFGNSVVSLFLLI